MTLVAGIARISSVRASAGQVQVAALGSIDVPRLLLDATIELEAPAPEALSVRPGAIVRWSGPLAAPERRIEAAALAGAIALRAMEREMREIERRDAKPPGVPPILVEPPANVRPRRPRRAYRCRPCRRRSRCVRRRAALTPTTRRADLLTADRNSRRLPLPPPPELRGSRIDIDPTVGTPLTRVRQRRSSVTNV